MTTDFVVPVATASAAPEGTPCRHGEFDDIRPYRDAEVRPVLDRLIADPELTATLLNMKFPRLWPQLHWLVRPLIRRATRRAFAGMNSVADFQELIRIHLERLVQRVTRGVTVSGAEKLSPGVGYLFISNHRDIAMDPALLDLVLIRRGLDTVRIAIGDNLLTKPFASDLMRLNKSFIVKRAVAGRRDKFAALKQLSAYIRHSVRDEHCSVWIAQREGRAKDGIDRTDTALLKMLALSRAPGQSFADAIGELNIVPVAISYELDPCDADKARELHARKTAGAYHKQAHEDLASIYKGVVGAKGGVHFAFGELIRPAPADDDQLAAAIDHQIIANYRLQQTHIMAWEMLYVPDDRVAAWKRALAVHDWGQDEAAFGARLAAVPAPEREILLEMYANPVSSRLAQIRSC